MSNQKKNTPFENGIDVSGLCVPERLKELRTQHNLTQADLAKVLNASPREYWRLEQPNYCTRYANLLVLSVFYNVSLDYLFGLTNEQRKIYNEENYTGSIKIPGLTGMTFNIPNVEQFKKNKALSEFTF